MTTSLQSYLDHAGDGIFVLDNQTGRILNANKRAEQMLGYSREELLKLSAADIEVSMPQPAILDSHLRARQGAVTVEGIHRRKDGSTFPVEIRMASLAPEQPEQILAHVRDITERKRAEEALLDAARRKDEFLALLGHELRNPLAAISTAVQAFTGYLTGDQQVALKEMISGQVLLMRRLLDDLLDLGRITYGHIELKSECIELAEFLRTAAAPVESTLAKRSQELRIRLSSSSVQFMADPVRLEQIVANLLNNASQYTDDGGRIELSGGKEGSEVVIRCKDNGRGIAPDMRQRIFEPFIRGVRASDSHGEASLGIGLALAKQLAELHEGTISVESGGLGMGSEFTVRLPFVAPPSYQPDVVDSEEPEPSYHSRSIVVVEDNPTVAKAMEIALEQAGHKVHMFPDGPSALAGVSELKPDAFLLDIALPVMDGYELATKLKEQTDAGNALFIAISGLKRRQHPARRSDDFDYYFTKPVDFRALLALLETRSGAVPADPSEEHQEPGNSTRLRVLVVEDYADLAAATAALLRREGLEVRTALTGRAALEAAPDFRPQLILCDMNLPDMKGPEVISQLRSNPSTRHAHTVILTSMSEASVRTYNSVAGKLGVDAFMCKPITGEAVRTLASKLKQD